MRATTASDVAIQLAYAGKVVIVPGYGLAASQAQYAMREMTKLLEANGVDVTYAIHPVAGRMPGHMNVLLAEADVPYEQLVEMRDINPEFPRTDVAVLIGANDVVNPDARNNPQSPLFGMPILDVDRARSIIVLKRSMRSGYAGVDNPLFTDPKTSMLFGDAKESLAAVTAGLKELVTAPAFVAADVGTRVRRRAASHRLPLRAAAHGADGNDAVRDDSVPALTAAILAGSASPGMDGGALATFHRSVRRRHRHSQVTPPRRRRRKRIGKPGRSGLGRVPRDGRCLHGEVISNRHVVPVALRTVTRHDRRAAERSNHFDRLEKPAATVATTHEDPPAIVAIEPTPIIGVCPPCRLRVSRDLRRQVLPRERLVRDGLDDLGQRRSVAVQG